VDIREEKNKRGKDPGHLRGPFKGVGFFSAKPGKRRGFYREDEEKRS